MTLLELVIKSIASSPKHSLSLHELAVAIQMPPHLIHPTLVMMERKGLLVRLEVDWGPPGVELKQVYRLSKEIRANAPRWQ